MTSYRSAQIIEKTKEMGATIAGLMWYKTLVI